MWFHPTFWEATQPRKTFEKLRCFSLFPLLSLSLDILSVLQCGVASVARRFVERNTQHRVRGNTLGTETRHRTAPKIDILQPYGNLFSITKPPRYRDTSLSWKKRRSDAREPFVWQRVPSRFDSLKIPRSTVKATLRQQHDETKYHRASSTSALTPCFIGARAVTVLNRVYSWFDFDETRLIFPLRERWYSRLIELGQCVEREHFGNRQRIGSYIYASARLRTSLPRASTSAEPFAIGNSSSKEHDARWIRQKASPGCV